MKVAVSNEVVVRNQFGRFIKDCEDAGGQTIREAVERGAAMSRGLAPTGGKPDPRTIPLADSIEPVVLSRTSGVWIASARHALPIEFGAAPHEIPADVSFFWEREGRWWMKPAVYLRRTGHPGADPIHHPGNAAQPYLRPAYRAIMGQIMDIAKKYYPG